MDLRIITQFQILGIQRQGLNAELDDIETRLEEFPMTRAFLDLVDVLTDSSIPLNLGAGTRTPGFEPYLNFVRDSVFLKFNTRTYKNPGEKWQVSSGCLAVFKKLLDGYEPTAADFANPTASVGRHPGFHIMLSLLQSSETLRMILFILDEGCAHLDSYVDFAGKKQLERSCLLALQVRTKIEKIAPSNSDVSVIICRFLRLRCSASLRSWTLPARPTPLSSSPA